MTETPQHPQDRYIRISCDGSICFVPPAGSWFSEDQLAKIVHRMASINAELLLKRPENHPNKPNK